MLLNLQDGPTDHTPTVCGVAVAAGGASAPPRTIPIATDRLALSPPTSALAWLAAARSRYCSKHGDQHGDQRHRQIGGPPPPDPTSVRALAGGESHVEAQRQRTLQMK